MKKVKARTCWGCKALTDTQGYLGLSCALNLATYSGCEVNGELYTDIKPPREGCYKPKTYEQLITLKGELNGFQTKQ